MQDFFASFDSLIVFIHVISAVLWVGGMVALRFALHPSLGLIENNQQRMHLALMTMKRFFSIIIVFITLLLISAVLMLVAIDFKQTDVYYAVHLKEALWTIMALNFGYIVYLRSQAHRLFLEENFQDAKEKLGKIATKLIPLNIILGMIAIYFGIILRGL